MPDITQIKTDLKTKSDLRNAKTKASDPKSTEADKLDYNNMLLERIVQMLESGG